MQPVSGILDALVPFGRLRILEPTMPGLLERTSRSFYLSVRFLPGETREPIALAYLLARAADTIADTRALPVQQRLDWLVAFGERLGDPDQDRILSVAERLRSAGPTDGERQLLGSIAALFRAYDRLPAADRERTATVLATILEGMMLDRTWFPGQSATELRAIADRQDLDRYCYCVAGAVGEFWTRMHADHLPGLRPLQPALVPLGVRFGKGLQMVNILRDIPGDLRRGRCYLPAADLEALAVSPIELLEHDAHPRVRSLLEELVQQAFAHLEAGWQYVRTLPLGQPRLRLCCAWPLLIGLRTLWLIKRSPNPLRADAPVKVPRSEVYRLMAESTLRVVTNPTLDALWRRLVRKSGFARA